MIHAPRMVAFPRRSRFRLGKTSLGNTSHRSTASRSWQANASPVRAAAEADNRQALVDRVRQEIAAGTYETPAKLDAALDAMLTMFAPTEAEPITCADDPKQA